METENRPGPSRPHRHHSYTQSCRRGSFSYHGIGATMVKRVRTGVFTMVGSAAHYGISGIAAGIFEVAPGTFSMLSASGAYLTH